MTTYSDFFGVLTYTDPLIYYKPESHSSWRHRELSIKRDVFLNKFICQLDAEIFQELPIFIPDILQSDEDIESPNEPIDGAKLISSEYKHILKEWEKEQYSALFIRMFDAARTHKWCIVQLYSDIPYWRVFTYREVKEINYDDNDQPLSAKVMWAKQLPRAISYNLHEETLNFIPEKAIEMDKNGDPTSQALFINFGTDLDTRIETTDIENKWSLAVYMRYIILDIINNSAKSSGFFWIKYGSQMDDPGKAEVDAMFEKANSGNAVGATENLIEDMKAMYMINPEFPVEALDKLLKIFSGACGLPLLYFNGEKEEGSIFGENTSAMAQVNDKKKAIFGQFKRYILKIVEMRWGITCDDVFPNLEEEEEEQYKEDIIEPSSTPGNGEGDRYKEKKVSVK